MPRNTSKLKVIVSNLLLYKKQIEKITAVHIDIDSLQLEGQFNIIQVFGTLYIFRGEKDLIAYPVKSYEDLRLSIKLMEAFVKGKEY